ncbi:DUF3592 domain-containing protein [Saccharothrix sp. Mg75]|uniref:DUF3592 domain-containing protein n=1 Tax=Saccharothrix sp. Mg75 TaxID=3445357 RepID=UPI003EECF69C
MFEATIRTVRRLGWTAVLVRGRDDLEHPARHSVPEEVATQAVRRLRRRGLVVLSSGAVLFTGFVVGATLLVGRADELLATGGTTPGVVVGTESGFRGAAGSVEVRFAVEGVERTRWMNLDDTSPVLDVGDPITVFYDRRDPERIAAPGVANDPLLPSYLTIGAFVVSVVLLPPGLIGWTRWSRRARALRRHGWRRGHVEVRDGRGHRIRFPADPHRREVTAVTTHPVAHSIPPEFRTGEVLVGGRGRRLTLVFTLGPVLAAARERPDRGTGADVGEPRRSS